MRSIAISVSVCMFVCLSVCLYAHIPQQLHFLILSIRVAWLLLVTCLTTVRYVLPYTSGFVDDVMWPLTGDLSSVHLPFGEAKSDVCDCFVLQCFTCVIIYLAIA